jgi:hypothetical protein
VRIETLHARAIGEPEHELVRQLVLCGANVGDFGKLEIADAPQTVTEGGGEIGHVPR